jgi:hypothetical protein
MEIDPITWKSNHKSSLIEQMTADELDLFEADINDAIDGVIEDWEGK